MALVSQFDSISPPKTLTSEDMALILRHPNTNPNTRGRIRIAMILIVAKYVGVHVQLSPSVGQFVLDTADGPVVGLNAIARYVAKLGKNNLFGSSLIDQAHIDHWIELSKWDIEANMLKLMQRGHGIPLEMRKALEAMDIRLAHNNYLVGYSITIADIIATSTLFLGFEMFNIEFLEEFFYVENYFRTMVSHPNFQKILGQVMNSEDEPKKVAKSKAKKPEVEVEEAPKPKNPLDLLPPSKMILDDWKKLYSITTTDFREVAIKGFWDMYDPKGYSLWFCDYKYNDENKASFLPLNRVAGFLHRMVLARKYAFGKMLIIGTEPPFKVKGLWLFRGQDIQPFIKDCYDMELYEWTKVDISDEGQKERVSQMIEDAEPFEGEALLDAMCFK